MATLTFDGQAATEIFLEDLELRDTISGEGTRPLGSGLAVFHTPAAVAGSTARISILSQSFTTLRTLSHTYQEGTAARISEPAIGLDFRHRATGTAQITPVRVAGFITRWRLEVEVTEQ